MRILITGCALLLAAGPVMAGKDGAKAKLGKPAPNFTLNDQDGKPVTLASFKGRVVVLEWVNHDCPVWDRVAKSGTTKALAGKYGEKDVTWLGINTTHYTSASTNQKLRSDYELAYAILDDHDGKVGRLYGAKTTPHMFIVDPKGRLAYRGAIDSDNEGAGGAEVVNYVDRGLEDLLAGKACSTPETKPYGCSVKYKK